MNKKNPDPVTQTILSNVTKGVREGRLRCKESIDHLNRNEPLGAIGALAGLEERVRYAITILQVLRQWQDSQHKTKEGK